ncbi:MAG: S8 family serine peptidase [Bacteroidota bacterium]
MKHTLSHLLLSIILLGTIRLTAQQPAYLVTFTHKPDTHFNASTYFHPHTLERRKLQGLPPYDWFDLPVHKNWVDSVIRQTDSVRHVLRWVNGMTLHATAAQITRIQNFPFVKNIEKLQYEAAISVAPQQPKDQRLDTLLYAQRNLMNLNMLQDSGLTGEGVRIAVFDVGFREVDTHPAFEELRKNNKIEATQNFYRKSRSVYAHNDHGLNVLGCIAGQYKGKPIGCAPGATFLLARTEHKIFEKAKEEDHWMAAAEWADKNGADLINSSLGYTRKRYTYADMDGETALVAQAARIATQKGILVINSLGNSGDNKWNFLGTPADVPEVLSVGAVYPMFPLRMKFSSYGPNADSLLKPEVSAPGYVLTAGKKGRYETMGGTSFSAPLVTGFAACVLQKYPGLRPAQLKQVIMGSSKLFPYFDYAHGFGVPDAYRLLHFQDDSTRITPTFSVSFLKYTIFVQLNDSVMAADTALHQNGRAFFFHTQKPNGKLATYSFSLIPLDQKQFLLIRQSKGEVILRIWFAGYLYEKRLLGS